MKLKDRSLVLHIGMPKTGSSSIQAALEGYDDGTTAYLAIGSSNHSELARTLVYDSAGPPPDRLPQFAASTDELAARRRRLIRRLDAFAALNRPQSIFSAESLYHMKRPGFDRICGILGRRFGRIRVIGYLRTPRSFVESSFQQKIKTGRPEFRLDDPRYRDKLEKLATAPNVVSVSLRAFDRGRLTDGNVVTDFLGQLGPLHRPITVSLERNTALSAEATALLFVLNRIEPEPADADRDRLKARLALAEALQDLPGSRLRLSAAVLAPLDLERDLDWLRATWGVELAEPDPTGPATEIGSGGDLEALAAATLERIGPLAAGLDAGAQAALAALAERLRPVLA